jgi:glycosyltransferase involved in cell wall biosynthesis
VGGLERFVVDLAREQKQAGHDPSLYCIIRGGPLVRDAESAGIPVLVIGKPSRKSLRLLLRLARHLWRDAPDVVHTHNPGIHPYGAIAARLAGVRAVLNTRHGVSTSSGAPPGEWYYRAVLPLTNKIVFVSEDSRRVLVEQQGLPSSKAHVVLNGVSLAEYSQLANPGALRPQIRFGTVGRMVPVKAQNILIDSFALLQDRLPGACLRIVGGGPLMNELQAQVERLSLAGRVTVEGITGDVPGVLRDLDIFVMSSLSEGLPIVILEAMAAGLPIVSTRVGGIPEVAPEGTVARYCVPGSAPALAQAMYDAATIPNLAEIGRAARAVVCQHYSMSHSQEDYESLYRELLR